MKNCDTIFSVSLELTLSLVLSTEQPYPTVSSTHTLSIDTPRITAMDIVRLFEEDSRARKRLAEILVSDESVRLAIINAVLRDVATKRDLEKLENRLGNELRQEISRLENRIDRLEERVGRLEDRVGAIEQKLASLEGRIDLLIKVFIGFNVPPLVAVIGILLKMVLAL